MNTDNARNSDETPLDDRDDATVRLRCNPAGFIADQITLDDLKTACLTLQRIVDDPATTQQERQAAAKELQRGQKLIAAREAANG
jgi:hypothetical protein